MFLQIDASHHGWLQRRRPRLTLLSAIDDATGKVVALRFPRERGCSRLLPPPARGLRPAPGALHRPPQHLLADQRPNAAGAARRPPLADAVRPRHGRARHPAHRRALTASQRRTPLGHPPGPPRLRAAPRGCLHPRGGQRLPARLLRRFQSHLLSHSGDTRLRLPPSPDRGRPSTPSSASSTSASSARTTAYASARRCSSSSQGVTASATPTPPSRSARPSTTASACSSTAVSFPPSSSRFASCSRLRPLRASPPRQDAPPRREPRPNTPRPGHPWRTTQP